jgi:hypothetical protein
MRLIILDRDRVIKEDSKVQIEIAIMLFKAFGTNTMGKIGFRMIPDIYFHLLPVPIVVSDFLAEGTYGQQTSQCLDFSERIF